MSENSAICVSTFPADAMIPAPIQYIAMVRKFCIESAIGCIADSRRSAPRALSRRSFEALSNLSLLRPSALNARMVRTPTSSSRVSEFTESTNHCMRLVYGMALQVIRNIDPRSMTNAPAVTAVHWKSLDAIFSVAHTPMTGALNRLTIARAVNCCIWLTSLVDLVIRDAAENESTSCLDQAAMFLNCLSRSSMQRDAAALEARTAAENDRARLATAHPTMAEPLSAMTDPGSPACRR